MRRDRVASYVTLRAWRTRPRPRGGAFLLRAVLRLVVGEGGRTLTPSRGARETIDLDMTFTVRTAGTRVDAAGSRAPTRGDESLWRIMPSSKQKKQQPLSKAELRAQAEQALAQAPKPVTKLPMKIKRQCARCDRFSSVLVESGEAVPAFKCSACGYSTARP